MVTKLDTTKFTKNIPDGYDFYMREFLNKPGNHSTAAVYAKVDKEDGYATLTISDCCRQIEIDLGSGRYNDREGNENAEYKLLLIETACRELRKRIKANYQKFNPGSGNKSDETD